MGDYNVYGPELHRLPFAKAVDHKMLSDYRVIVLGVSGGSVTPGLRRRLEGLDTSPKRKQAPTTNDMTRVLGVSLASTNYMIDAGVPQRLFEIIDTYVSGQATFLLALLIFLLILGALLDIFSAIILVVPLILPVAALYGIHPVHLGIVFLAAMELGYLTPPVGLNLFISSFRFERSIADIFRATFPFFILLLITVVIIAYWPGLSLVLLNL